VVYLLVRVCIIEKRCTLTFVPEAAAQVKSLVAPVTDIPAVDTMIFIQLARASALSNPISYNAISY
jgi:hypothetical protein